MAFFGKRIHIEVSQAALFWKKKKGENQVRAAGSQDCTGCKRKLKWS
jgi:hypothetical protein